MHIEGNRDAFIAWMRSDPRGPVVMLNLLRFREWADYSASPELAPDAPIAGRQAYGLYARHTAPFLDALGSKVLFQAAAGPALIGPEGQRWDKVLVVQHPSAQEFIGFATNDAYLAGTGHRTAALADSRLIPMTGWTQTAPWEAP